MASSRNRNASPNMTAVSNIVPSKRMSSNSLFCRSGSVRQNSAHKMDIIHCPHDALAGVLSEAVKGKTVKEIKISKSTTDSGGQLKFPSSPVKVIKLQVCGQRDNIISESTTPDNKSVKSFYKKSEYAPKFTRISLARKCPQGSVIGSTQTKPPANILKVNLSECDKYVKHSDEVDTRKDIKPKSALDEFLESVEHFSSPVPQKFVPNSLENHKNDQRSNQHTESRSEHEGTRFGRVPNSSFVNNSSPRAKPKVLVDPEFVFNSQLSVSPAISPFLHFNPNGRVPVLLNPLISNNDIKNGSIIDEIEKLTGNEFPTLDSIFRDFKDFKEREASIITTSPTKSHKLSIGEVRRLLTQNDLKSSPSLNSFMGRQPDTSNAAPAASYKELFGGQQFTKFASDSYSPIPTGPCLSSGSTEVISIRSPAQNTAAIQNTPLRKEPTNAFKLLTCSAPPIDKYRDVQTSRKRKLLESKDEKGADHLHPALVADPGSHKRIRRSMKRLANDEKQLVLDFGQSDFGAKYCKTCGFVYTPSHPDDLKLHERFHNKKNRLLKYTLKGEETVVDAFEDGCIVQVDYYNTKTFPNSQGGAFSSATSRSNCSHLERVVSELRERVDVELGFVEDSKDRLSPKILVFISRDNYLTGYLLAEEIKFGYRVVIDEEEPSEQSSSNFLPAKAYRRHAAASNDSCASEDSFAGPASWSCSLTPERAVCGVSRIWVAPQHKRKAIATRMVDALRKQFSDSEKKEFATRGKLSTELLAFSDPTDAGRRFAASYCGREDFLVFKCIQSDQPVRDFLKEEEEKDKLLL